MRKVRWGILGTASIAIRQAIPAIRASSSGETAAIASRSLERAKEIAAAADIPKAYGSYDELLGDPDIDAVYIPLPNDMHLPWIERSVRAGKDVLCEKPLGLNAEEVRRAMELARETGRFVMEGFASHFQPIHHRAAELVREGAIGELRFIRVSLGWSFQGKRDDYRWQKERGGGGLLDIGCYCIAVSRLFAGSEPEKVSSRATFDPQTDVDTNMAILLGFPGGVQALIDCGILSATRNHYELIGSEGRITVLSPFGNRHQDRILSRFDVQGNKVGEETFNVHQFEVQFETVSRHILEGKAPPVPLEETLKTALVMDRCMASARSQSSTEGRTDDGAQNQ